jgi:hypothetical protein
MMLSTAIPGRIAGLIFAGSMLAVPDVLAQPASPPVEDVTVTGTRSREAIEGFVQSLATPTRVTDKVARWEEPICPTTVGFKKQFAEFINQRVRDTAAKVGAPVATKADCAPNIAIVFTTAPDVLLANIRKRRSEYLGYYDNSAQLDGLVKITHPIQSWYATETKDLRGNTQVDSGKTAGTGLDITYACPPPQIGVCTMHISNGHAGTVTGSRLGDGMRSAFYNVIIVADPTKLVDYEIGTLSDYIAMLALAQVNAPDTCQPLASIMNLLAKDCSGKSSALTDNDLGYLRALYKMGPDRTLQVQRNEMIYQMQQSLLGH